MDFGIKRRLMAGNWCSSDVCYKLRLKVWTQPENGKEIVHTYIQLGFNPLLQLLTFSGPITYKHSRNSAHNGQSLDIAPGSRIGQDYLGAVEGNIIGLSIQTILHAVTGRFHKSDNKSMHSNFIPTVSSTAYTFPNGEPLNYYKNFTGVTLSKCAGTTPFDTVYAPDYDMKHVGIDANIANAFKSEVYYSKPSSACGSTPCPQHLVKNSTVPAGTTVYQAEKSITLNPGFEVTPGKVFKAQAGGCNNGSNLAENSQGFGGSTPLVPECTFEWDTGKLHSQCEGSLTRYQVYVKNIPYDSYPEFSVDGSTWLKAAIGSTGHEFLLPGTTGWTMYARIKNKPAVVIQYTFSPCSTGGGSTPISFNNTLRTKLCVGGQITQTVYVDNLPSGAIAQFSTNGGSTWYNANVGGNGYSFTQTPTNTNHQFLARSTSHPGSYVTTNYHASCSNPATMDWGPWSVSTHSPGVCKYEVSVTGLATDSYAEFSIDGGNSWVKAQAGNYGHVFLLLWGNVSHQDFWFRPGERPDYSGTWGHLPMCSN